ncbi:MAG TPA: putative quinol monooxygenase [Caulobacteraceae bacterium]|jgi:quinol monooxygenase YgiN
MSKLAIIGTLEVEPGRRGEVLTAMLAHKTRCLRDEPGTLQFEVLTPLEDETRVLLYEIYRDEAAFEEHWNNPSLARFRDETAGIAVKLEVTKCAPVL